MGWSIGNIKGRDVGYGVPAVCDHPGCAVEIHRGISYVCGSDPGGGEYGCGLYFCSKHRTLHDDEHIDGEFCERCRSGDEDSIPFDATPDTKEWLQWKLTDESWAQWRNENPVEVQRILKIVNEA